jgi:hypothetical protein
MKRQMGKYLKNISYQGLISKMYKEFIQLGSKENTHNWILKLGILHQAALTIL